MRAFLKSCVDVVVRRRRFFVVLNLIFLWTVFASALFASFFVPPPFENEGLKGVPFLVSSNDWFAMIFVIFLFNLCLSAFAIVTLPGFVLFFLSGTMLVYRGVIWGLLLAFMPADFFVLVLPTLLLEAEAYVLAGVAGTVLGLSWLMPKRVYGNEIVSRRQALRMALKETLFVYFIVTLILFSAAVVETATIYLFI